VDATTEPQEKRNTMRNKTTIVAEPGKPTIVITRTFDAPARLVWDAMTSAEHMPKWWGPRSCPMSKCVIDFRVGGKYLWATRVPDGSEHEFYGVYREIVPGKRLVYTQTYAPFPDAAAVVTISFAEENGKTQVVTHVLHEKVEHRDAHVSSGMESGLIESYERVDELLHSMK
jgi:uncharacterized protein YndB with AHSA1/START domain